MFLNHKCYLCQHFGFCLSTPLYLCALYLQLYINTAMCVNTLRYECTTFYVEHRCSEGSPTLEREVFGEESSIPRRDGRNESSRDTFPCHYNPSKPNSTDQFVTIRLNILHSICILYFSSSILYCASTARWTF